MEKVLNRSLVVIVIAFVITGYFSIEAKAASGSCQSKQEGKLDCMEFVGNLSDGLKSICKIAGRANWVDSACPQENVLGYCEVPRNDNIRQISYCYRMNQIPDAQRIDYCRMGCNGTFNVTQSRPSAPATSTVIPTPPSTKPKATANVPATTNPKPATPAASPRFAMEENTNRYGEDYRDIGLPTPNPALCAQACMKDKKCRAWTYVKPGVQADNAWCWLKDKVPPPTPDENCVSGVKEIKK